MNSELILRRAVLLLPLLALGLAACSTSGPHPSAIKGSTTSKAPRLPTTTLGPMPSTPTVPATTTFPAGPPCTNGQVAVSIQASYVGTGNAAEELGFRNVSQSPCNLFGYPGVAALGAQSQQIAQATRVPLDGAPTAVNLQPGQIAEALVQGSDGAIRTCDGAYYAHTFLVTPPNLTQSAAVAAMASSDGIAISEGCGIDVSPVSQE
jgi:Protein of unknown function (DUF4232)